jgi:hypothetical protein
LKVDSNTVVLSIIVMPESLSLEELSQQVNAWCAEHGIEPASGQVGELVSERNVRYYRTLGLVDAPVDGRYTEKHLLQLSAIRLLQAQGLPLRRIRELLLRSVPLRSSRDSSSWSGRGAEGYGGSPRGNAGGR